MTPLSTPWSAAMGLRVPILNAPMGGVAGGELAVAVSAAGGLGMIGIGSAGSVTLLKRESKHPHGVGLPFGIGLIDWVLHREPALLDAALSAQPVLVSVSFGDDMSWVDQTRQAGIVTATQVFDIVSAQRAEDAGVEILVARGAEGGGHGQTKVGTLPLLEAVLDTVSVPVIAAGGISTARSLAAVLAAGASGAWVGTAFSACPESLLSEPARDALLRASATDTVTTRAFDVALGYPWPTAFEERVLRNDFSQRWSGREDELARDSKACTALRAAIASGDPSMAAIDAGQGVGLLTQIRPAAAVVESLSAGAARLLGSAIPPRSE